MKLVTCEWCPNPNKPHPLYHPEGSSKHYTWEEVAEDRVWQLGRYLIVSDADGTTYDAFRSGKLLYRFYYLSEAKRWVEDNS